MKSAKDWTDLFCNQHIINVRGSEVQQFIKQVQDDALESAALECEQLANDSLFEANADECPQIIRFLKVAP